MTELNTRQKKVLEAWWWRLQVFTRREWFSIFVSYSLGIIAAGGVRLALRDHSFQSFLISNYKPSLPVDDPRPYVLYLIALGVTGLLAIALLIPRFLGRGLRSWFAGVTSGLTLLSFGFAFLFLALPSPSFSHGLINASTMIFISFLVSFVLYMRAQILSEKPVLEEDLKVSKTLRSLRGTQLPESDDPIQTWAQDALGRASLVDSISIKILISKSPVLALSGPFGSGKTSTLNLLREHLGDKTITVSFSTWLPGSQDTLTSYLLNDVANECKKQFVVPGLRQSARRLATVLGKSVPLLKNYIELLPAATQKDDIEALKTALTRLPKRVVVLLDEIDRMERDELITLLKVIRGVSTLPNLSFVCAGDRKTIVEIVKGDDNEKNNIYFEKFFPVTIQIPEADPVALRRTGTERLIKAFSRRDWFESEDETDAFRKQIEELWNERIAFFCPNLRAIGLLANDVSVAAAPLRREVDPIDLTFVELLRRFKPSVYELVARNSEVLTGGETLARGGPFRSEEDKKTTERRLIADLQQLVKDAEELDEVKGILGELFPRFVKLDGQSRVQRPRRKGSDHESDKRILQPGIFPAYFRYELPEAIFSSLEMKAFLDQMERADKDSDRENAFLEILDSMGKGSLKRDDFLRKLATEAESMSLQAGKALTRAAVHAANQYFYEPAFPSLGESGHVLRIVTRIAKRLSQTDRVGFLQECILNSTDDTMALNILRLLTKQEAGESLEVPVAQLYPSFIKRMRKLYGPTVDAAKVDLTTADPWAFDFWGRDPKAYGITADPEDRKIQYDFWLRYIGNNKPRLAQAFRQFFLPIAAYSEDAALAVENKISIPDLKRLYERLPDDPILTDRDRQSLATLRRLLDGEFKNGISPIDGLYRDQAEPKRSTRYPTEQ